MLWTIFGWQPRWPGTHGTVHFCCVSHFRNYHTSTFGVHLASCYVLMNATTVTTTTTTADFGHEHRRSWSIQDFPLLLLLGHPWEAVARGGALYPYTHRKCMCRMPKFEAGARARSLFSRNALLHPEDNERTSSILDDDPHICMYNGYRECIQFRGAVHIAAFMLVPHGIFLRQFLLAWNEKKGQDASRKTTPCTAELVCETRLVLPNCKPFFFAILNCKWMGQLTA